MRVSHSLLSSNGEQLAYGLGTGHHKTYGNPKYNTVDLVKTAIELGYRHFDTAEGRLTSDLRKLSVISTYKSVQNMRTKMKSEKQLGPPGFPASNSSSPPRIAVLRA